MCGYENLTCVHVEVKCSLNIRLSYSLPLSHCRDDLSVELGLHIIRIVQLFAKCFTLSMKRINSKKMRVMIENDKIIFHPTNARDMRCPNV